ncbi:hypothetical protein E4U55_007131, partial [Claviceps digitariae]
KLMKKLTKKLMKKLTKKLMKKLTKKLMKKLTKKLMKKLTKKLMKKLMEEEKTGSEEADEEKNTGKAVVFILSADRLNSRYLLSYEN